MSERPRILIIDDDVDLLSILSRIMSREGYEVLALESAAEATTALDEEAWDVVILDLRLQGPVGGDGGLQVLKDVALRNPGAKTILISGYASPASIDVAFSEGAYDVIEKSTPNFHTLLKAKVRNALELVQERRLAQLTDSAREAQIRDLWRALPAGSAQEKGARLEALMVLIFQSISGLHRVAQNLRNDVEEIDLILRNESTDPFWQKEPSQYILVECKNWSGTVGAEELDRFRSKVERRYERSKTGFLIAPGGFTQGFRVDRMTDRKGAILIVPVDAQGLEDLVQSEDRNATLKDLHERAVLAANGSLKR